MVGCDSAVAASSAKHSGSSLARQSLQHYSAFDLFWLDGRDP
jgi:hypothetical protein